jgi:multiple sugar transport system permease protein
MFKYYIIAPAIIILLMLGIFPFIQLLIASFQNVTMISEDTSFAGGLNYERLFSDGRFWWSLIRTVVFMLIALPVELVLGTLLAIFFLERFAGRQFYLAAIIIPTVIAPIVAGSTWRLMFDNRFGPINQILSWISGSQVDIVWVINPSFVWFSIFVAEVWQWTPFMFLILLAAISNVDRSQIEAAQIDGASALRIFFRITVPAIRPVLVVVLLIRALDLFRLLDVVWTMTKGGPGTRTETVSLYAYVQGFQQFQISYTAALALVVVVSLSILVTLALRQVEIQR